MNSTLNSSRKAYSISTFKATVTIGLQKGYTEDSYLKSEVILALQDYQKNLINEQNIFLSACISDCDIVLSGQVEPHLKLEFINYPRFEMKQEDLKNEILKLSDHLMDKFQQNRMVIQFDNETVMLENNSEVDPRIE